MSKRGRGPSPHSLLELQQYYHSSNSRPWGSVTANSRDVQQFTWVQSCGVHTVQRQAASLARSMLRARKLGLALPSCLTCKLCPGQPVQQGMCMPPCGERQLCDWLGQAGIRYETQFKVLLGWYGALDVWLPQYRVGVMVDGEQHFPSHHTGHHTTSSIAQAEIDARFNAAVLGDRGARIGGLVRLHHHDYQYWMRHVCRAIAQAQEPDAVVFVLFTKSYGHADIVFRH